MKGEIGFLARTRRLWAELPAPRRKGPPTPGDVVALEGSLRSAVEWAVLSVWRGRGRAGEPLERCLVVAADGQPMVGSADFEAPTAVAASPLILRCRFGGWVGAGQLATSLHSATLVGQDLSHIVDHWHAVQEGSVVGSASAQEVDDDPDYEDWLRTIVEPAWRALAPNVPHRPSGL